MIIANQTTFDFEKSDDIITLDETARHRRRVKMKSDKGIEFLLDLSEAKLLRHGEGLVLSDGRLVEVCAEPELLFKVSGQNIHHLLSLTWQLGNRHLPTQICDDHLFIRADHVIKDMLVGLGAQVEERMAPFDPEGGAYSGDHAHSHHNGGYPHHD